MNSSETEIWSFLVENKCIEFQNFRSKDFERIAVNLYQNNLNDVKSLIDDITYIDYLDIYFLVKFTEKLLINNDSDRDEIINKLINKLIDSRTYIEKRWFISHEKYYNIIIHLVK